MGRFVCQEEPRRLIRNFYPLPVFRHFSVQAIVFAFSCPRIPLADVGRRWQISWQTCTTPTRFLGRRKTLMEYNIFKNCLNNLRLPRKRVGVVHVCQDISQRLPTSAKGILEKYCISAVFRARGGISHGKGCRVRNSRAPTYLQEK